MLVLFPVLSVGHHFRGMLEVYREPITRNTRTERLILEIELEAEPVAIVRNRSVKVINQKPSLPTAQLPPATRRVIWATRQDRQPRDGLSRIERFAAFTTLPYSFEPPSRPCG
jgi:hypothetical protein